MHDGMDITISSNLYGDIVDVSNKKQFSNSDDIITVNMDGGVGGSWTVHSSEPKLKENQQEPLDL